LLVLGSADGTDMALAVVPTATAVADRRAARAVVQADLSLLTARFDATIGAVGSDAADMIGRAFRSDAGLGTAVSRGATLAGRKAADIGAAGPAFGTAFAGDGAEVPAGGAAELLTVAGAVAAGVISTLGHSGRAAIRSAFGRSLRAAAVVCSTGNLHAGAGPRLGRGRWASRRLSVQGGAAGQGCSAEAEEPLQDLPPVGARRQRTCEGIERAIVHEPSFKRMTNQWHRAPWGAVPAAGYRGLAQCVRTQPDAGQELTLP
jgi:hypothetical protein